MADWCSYFKEIVKGSTKGQRAGEIDKGEGSVWAEERNKKNKEYIKHHSVTGYLL